VSLFQTINIADVQLFAGSFSQAVELIVEECSSSGDRANRLVSLTGAHGIVTAQLDHRFRETLRGFFLNLPDGMPGVFFGRRKGAKNMQRCYGPDVFREVIKRSANLPINHFLCGGKDGVAEELKLVCLNRFGNSRCVGTFSPPFREMTHEEFVSLGEAINTSGADIVWVGMSTPKQELFARKLAGYISVHFIITVGAAFDFHTARLRQAPRFVQRIGMEWFFRLLMEPRRLFKRYLLVVPLFLYYATRDLLQSKLALHRMTEER
jgi:N-acetylglucosaminyldiphosphoundecaprenol N-acetyl-beta-D-mannosaminyltransferase